MVELQSLILWHRSYGLSSSSSSTPTDYRAKYNEAADMLAEARNELDDFVHSSKELEEELLRELERTEKTQKELKDKISRVESDRDDWKVRLLFSFHRCPDPRV
jgi:sugar-specific transcriptional regulator TrmB